MNRHLNLWAVLAAAAWSFALGGLWYCIFSAQWKKANGFQDEPPAGNPAYIFGIGFLWSLRHTRRCRESFPVDAIKERNPKTRFQ
jgi:Protein of unknown function (DUF1761)